MLELNFAIYHRATSLSSQASSVDIWLNPLPTKANCFRKQESMYKVLTPNIKPPIKILISLWDHLAAIGCKGLRIIRQALAN